MSLENADSTSKFQDSLPVSSDAIIALLEKLSIFYRRFDHVPLMTVEDSKKIESLFLASADGGGHIKNLYLRDTKKSNFLVVAEQDRKIDLKALPNLLGSGRLSFGSSERLFMHLGVRPGALTPLSMITGVKNEVKIVLDENLRKCRKLYVHPLVNDRTLEVDIEGLEKFFKYLGTEPTWINLSSGLKAASVPDRG